jgi:hypothetical protein
MGYEMLTSVNFSPPTIRSYAVILYEKGRLFISVDCYKSPGGWIITQMDFNTKAQLVLPERLLVRE